MQVYDSVDVKRRSRGFLSDPDFVSAWSCLGYKQQRIEAFCENSIFAFSSCIVKVYELWSLNYWNYFFSTFHFIPSISFPTLLSAWRRSVADSRDQNNNVTSTNQPESLVCRPLLQHRRSKLGRDCRLKDRQNVLSIPRKEANGHWCHKAVSLLRFVCNLPSICYVFVS